jgi:hypothetical protein
MSFGIGQDRTVGYGNADTWGGPMNGVDLESHIGNVIPIRKHRVSEDGYMAIIILGALVALWVLGGIAFKGRRI